MALLLNNSSKSKETITTDLKQELFDRLKVKGMEKVFIHSYIRSVKICLGINPTMNHLQLDKELQFLGWNDFEMDYHTMQLAIAFFETEAVIDPISFNLKEAA